ncbi:hypothetical protein [Terricaulis sp.]|uniref:hypothetical protein n=1 Tax=Terricaulis sp. TaxID=2768686 RepID=UPI0037845E03
MKHFAIASLLVLAACGQASAPATYPPAAELAFQRSCQASARRAAGPNVEQAALTGYCSCVWGRIRAEIPYAEFEAYERMSPGERPASATQQKFVEFAAACAPQQQPKP